MTRFRALALLAAAAALLVLASACFENSNDGQAPSSIAVSGTGEVRAEPNIATIRVGVEVRADSVAEARGGAAEAAAAVLATVLASGIEEADVRTTDFSIRPEYDYRGETPRVIGYVVSDAIEVTVRELDGIGDLIDAVAEAGGDAIRLGGISFAHADADALARQARDLAVEDARAKAEQLAELGGVTLGSVISLTETSWAAPLVYSAPEADFAMADQAAGTSIQPGTTGVTVTILAVWEIDD